MEKLIKAAQIAWNPFQAVRTRIVDGNLSLGQAVIPFLTVIITCNIFEFEAMRYYIESINFAEGRTVLNIPPLMSNKFAQQFLTAFGAIFPIGVLFFIPKTLFHKISISTIGAVILIVTASITFYESLVSIMFYLLIGTLIQSDVSMAQSYMADGQLLAIVSGIVIFFIAIWFWYKVLIKILGLSKSEFIIILSVYVVGIVVLSMVLGVEI